MKKILFAVFSFILSVQTLCSEIIEIDHFDQLAEHLQHVDSNSLVAFDVDEMLLYSSSSLLRPTSIKILHEEMNKHLNNLSAEEFSILYSIVAENQGFLLINQNSPKLVQELKDKGAKVIALTAIRTGRVGNIPSMEDWRLKHLKELGFDFSDAFPEHEYVQFNDIEKKQVIPAFKKGVLASGNTDKGIVLDAFLDIVDWKPGHVYFADDRLKHVESVVKEMEKRGIKATGFHYKEAEKIPSDIDEKVLRYQANHLMQHKEWLKDEEAKTLYESQELAPAGP